MIALTLGTVLAVVALAFVLYPIFFGTAAPLASRRVSSAPSDADAAVSALREIEFDLATGKLSEADYADLKARYTRQAILAMRTAPATPAAAPSDDEVEAVVRAYRAQTPVCSTCGPRPEPDAVFCSTCGRYMHDRCADCGAPVEAHDARYCMRCGNRLAA